MPIEEKILIGALVVLLLALVWAAVVLVRFYRTQHFTCPECGASFRPTLFKMIVYTNAVEGKVLRCPHCHKLVYVEPVKNEPPDKSE